MAISASCRACQSPSQVGSASAQPYKERSDQNRVEPSFPVRSDAFGIVYLAELMDRHAYGLPEGIASEKAQQRR